MLVLSSLRGRLLLEGLLLGGLLYGGTSRLRRIGINRASWWRRRRRGRSSLGSGSLLVALLSSELRLLDGLGLLNGARSVLGNLRGLGSEALRSLRGEASLRSGIGTASGSTSPKDGLDLDSSWVDGLDSTTEGSGSAADGRRCICSTETGSTAREGRRRRRRWRRRWRGEGSRGRSSNSIATGGRWRKGQGGGSVAGSGSCSDIAEIVS